MTARKIQMISLAIQILLVPMQALMDQTEAMAMDLLALVQVPDRTLATALVDKAKAMTQETMIQLEAMITQEEMPKEAAALEAMIPTIPTSAMATASTMETMTTPMARGVALQIITLEEADLEMVAPVMEVARDPEETEVLGATAVKTTLETEIRGLTVALGTTVLLDLEILLVAPTLEMVSQAAATSLAVRAMTEAPRITQAALVPPPPAKSRVMTLEMALQGAALEATTTLVLVPGLGPAPTPTMAIVPEGLVQGATTTTVALDKAILMASPQETTTTLGVVDLVPTSVSPAQGPTTMIPEMASMETPAAQETLAAETTTPVRAQATTLALGKEETLTLEATGPDQVETDPPRPMVTTGQVANTTPMGLKKPTLVQDLEGLAITMEAAAPETTGLGLDPGHQEVITLLVAQDLDPDLQMAVALVLDRAIADLEEVTTTPEAMVRGPITTEVAPVETMAALPAAVDLATALEEMDLQVKTDLDPTTTAMGLDQVHLEAMALALALALETMAPPVGTVPQVVANRELLRAETTPAQALQEAVGLDPTTAAVARKVDLDRAHQGLDLVKTETETVPLAGVALGPIITAMDPLEMTAMDLDQGPAVGLLEVTTPGEADRELDPPGAITTLEEVDRDPETTAHLEGTAIIPEEADPDPTTATARDLATTDLLVTEETVIAPLVATTQGRDPMAVVHPEATATSPEALTTMVALALGPPGVTDPDPGLVMHRARYLHLQALVASSTPMTIIALEVLPLQLESPQTTGQATIQATTITPVVTTLEATDPEATHPEATATRAITTPVETVARAAATTLEVMETDPRAVMATQEATTIITTPEETETLEATPEVTTMDLPAEMAQTTDLEAITAILVVTAALEETLGATETDLLEVMVLGPALATALQHLGARLVPLMVAPPDLSLIFRPQLPATPSRQVVKLSRVLRSSSRQLATRTTELVHPVIVLRQFVEAPHHRITAQLLAIPPDLIQLPLSLEPQDLRKVLTADPVLVTALMMMKSLLPATDRLLRPP
jgi:hypothetical protein